MKKLEDPEPEPRPGAAAFDAGDLRFRALVENSTDGITLVDARGQVLYASPSSARILGYAPGERMGRSAFENLHPDDVANARQAFAEVLAAAGATARLEVRVRHKDGRWIWLRAVITNRLDQPAVQAVVGNYEDVTERRQAEERVQLYADIAENMQLGLHVWESGDDNRSLRLIATNAEAVRLTGVPRQKALGRNLDDIFPVLAESGVPSSCHEVARSRRPIDLGDVPWPTEHGSTVLSMKAFPLPGGAVGVTFEDVTERRRLEHQLLLAQKMEAIGRLAGGVAHDFNNLLTAIGGYAELALRRLAPDDPVFRSVREVRRAADQAAALTRQLLAFSRRQVLRPEVVDPAALLADLQHMLGRLIGEDIHLEVVAAKRLGHVQVDPSQLEQVIVNLALNARDAMPHGGRLVIEAADADIVRSPPEHQPPMTPGAYVMLRVTDTGAGMDRETWSRVFEPFYTTKEPGKGTGLGLATVYGIVKQSGGYIWVESELRQGSTFTVYLPRVAGPASALPRRPEPATASTGGTETILLVEDDDAVRQMTREVLEAEGYQVLAAAGSRDALRLSQGHSAPVHLLITDVTMPEESGPQLAQRLGRLRPEMKVLYISGYAETVIAHHQIPTSLLVEKPFSPDVLAQRVRELLDPRSSPSQTTAVRAGGDPDSL